jgi:hypothetical protein
MDSDAPILRKTGSAGSESVTFSKLVPLGVVRKMLVIFVPDDE